MTLVVIVIQSNFIFRDCMKFVEHVEEGLYLRKKKQSRKFKECNQFLSEILLGFDVDVPADDYCV